MFSVPDSYLQSEDADDGDLIDLPPEVLAAIDQVNCRPSYPKAR